MQEQSPERFELYMNTWNIVENELLNLHVSHTSILSVPDMLRNSTCSPTAPRFPESGV
jgi:hypothetical protein